MDFHHFLLEEGHVVKASKGTFLFRQGEQSRGLYLVKSGVLKATYNQDDGKEFIKSFLVEGDLIGSLTALYNEEMCSFSLVCLEDVSVLEINFYRLYRKSLNDQELANNLMIFLLKFAMKKEQCEYELLCLSAEQRYRKMLESAPDITERITQSDLAAYLGITAVGLSRIKKRIIAIN